MSGVDTGANKNVLVASLIKYKIYIVIHFHLVVDYPRPNLCLQIGMSGGLSASTIARPSPASGGSMIRWHCTKSSDCQVRVRERERERERKMFYLTTHSTHCIYGYMASDIWLRTILIVRKETRCRHIGYSYRLTARVLLYASSHRQDSTYHGLCYTSRGALAGTRNSSMGPPHEGSIRRPTAP